MARRHAADASERRTVHVGFYVTPSERADIEMLAARTGLSPSELCRRKLFTRGAKELPVARDVKAIRDLIVAVTRVGTNLNQMQKLANETRQVPTAQRLDPILEKVMEALDAVTRMAAP